MPAAGKTETKLIYCPVVVVFAWKISVEREILNIINMSNSYDENDWANLNFNSKGRKK